MLKSTFKPLSLAAVLCGAGWLAASASPDKPAFKTQSLEEIKAWLAQDGVHDTYIPEAPLGFTEEQVKEGIPEGNPLTRAKVELGRQLYFDPRLSADGTVSCATCHDPAKGWSDASKTSSGIRGQLGGRNAPTVINRLFSKAQFWDGRAADLEAQALGPIENPIEMGSNHEAMIRTVDGIPGYKLQFEAVFGAKVITKDHVAQAIAAFERTVISGASPYDYYARAEPFLKLDEEELAELREEEPELAARADKVLAEMRAHPMSESAKRGMALFFGKASCSTCHTGANFTDELYYNLGVGMDAEKPDLGRFEVTGQEADKGAFKTPTLRNVADNAPYMHDGSDATLMDVMKLYNEGGVKNAHLSDRIKPLGLNEQEMKDLVEFMKALSGEVTQVTMPALPK